MIIKVCKNILSLVIAGWLLGVAVPAAARPIAYVTNQNSNTVSVIDITSNTVIATVLVGKNPSVVAVSPDGAFAYVTNAVSGSVSVIAIATNTVVETVAVGRVPEGIAVTPDGAFVYVAINDFNEPDGTVSVIATETNKLVATVNGLGHRPRGVAVTPDGAFVYVTNNGTKNGSTKLSVISTETNTVVANVRVRSRPLGVAITPDGKLAYVANRHTDFVSVIETATVLEEDPKVASVEVNGKNGIPGGPSYVAVTPDGAFVYVTYSNIASYVDDENFVFVIRTTDNTVVATIPVSAPPGAVAITPDGKFAYVTIGRSGTVLVIDTETNTTKTTVKVGDAPKGVAIADVDNEPPIANAGSDQAIRVGDTVKLDASASFDDNTTPENLTYEWAFSEFPEGSAPTLIETDPASPSFVADVAGLYKIQLIIKDEASLSSAPDEVVISSDGGNLAPTANAGNDRLVAVGKTVSLNGLGSSDPEMDSLTYIWSIDSLPTGSVATLSNADTEEPTFTPDVEGVYVVTLVVSDFLGPGEPDAVEITATTAESFAEYQILLVSDFIATLLPEEVTTQGNQKAFLNFLSQTVAAIQEGDIVTAISKLEGTLERTDGCFLRDEADGAGPSRDWITDCTVQEGVYPLLVDALDALAP